MKKIVFTGAAIVAALALTLTAPAHDAWVAPGAGPVYQILFGHKEPEAYQVQKVTRITVFDAAQRLLPFSRQDGASGVNITPTGQPAVFALEFDNGYWVKINGESRNLRKADQPTGTDPAHPLKFSKTILSWVPWLTTPLGQRIELVPVTATAPKAGDKLQLRLLLDGQPLAGQMIENNSDETGPRTDAAGRVTVTVRKGINRFATDYDIAQKFEPDAERLSLTAALVFEAR